MMDMNGKYSEGLWWLLKFIVIAALILIFLDGGPINNILGAELSDSTPLNATVDLITSPVLPN